MAAPEPSTRPPNVRSPAKGRGAGLAWAAIAMALLPATALAQAPAATELPPPAPLYVPDQGGRAELKGEPAPVPGARLAPLTPQAKRPVAPPARKERVGPAAAPPALAAPRPVPPRIEALPALMVLLDVGGIGLPGSAMTAFGYDGFASVRGAAVDVSVLWPTSPRHAFGARVGVGVPVMPARNWWGEGSTVTYIDIDVVALDLAFTYAYWRPLIGRLSLIGRAGLGLAIPVGDVSRIEVLPGCKAGQEARCPHWRQAGRLSDPLPAALPSVQLSGGLAFELGGGLHLRAEAGVRGLPWVGVGLGLRR